MRENRETPRVSGSRTPDRLVKATSYTASMHASGESHRAIVPAKCPNKGAVFDPRRAWREGPWPRRTTDPLTRAGLSAGTACHKVGRRCGSFLSAAIIQGKSRMR